MSRYGRQGDLGQRRRFELALMRVGSVRQRLRRRRERRLKQDGAPVVSVPIDPATDPTTAPTSRGPRPEQVRLAVLAMEALGRASLRASCSGVEVSVAAPDSEIAEIFRAALAETARNRATDRLIRVTVG